MDWAALSDFNLVARHGGFGRAARESGRPKATLSRRVAELEASLGVRLLERGSGRPRLTDEGRALHERTAPLLQEAAEATQDVASGRHQVRGTLRISAPQLFAQVAMGRLAAEFAQAHPAVRLDLTAEDRAASLVEDGFDLAIRVNPSPDPDLVGRILVRDRLLVVAPPGLAPLPAGGVVPAVVRGPTDGVAPWRLRGEPARVLRPEPRIGLSSLPMVRDAVRAGAGVAVLPLSLVMGDLERGRLTSWGEVEGGEVTLWTLHTSRRLRSPRLVAFLEHLARAFPDGAPEELAAFVDGG